MGMEKTMMVSKNADRSWYFARREAAKVLKCVLEGDARGRAVASIKSLVYNPSVRNKKATFALVCQTLKCLSTIKDVLRDSNVLNAKWKRKKELMYIITYEILFGKTISMRGDAERFLLLQKKSLQLALSQWCTRENVKHAKDILLLKHANTDHNGPRYVRVNSLKLDIDSAMQELQKETQVEKDAVVPDLLMLPPGTDIHNHPLVLTGGLFLQGRASCMVAVALKPEPDWEVLDACSAPGNKTVHLAALMRGKGRIVACEQSKERIRHLKDTVARSGACNVDIFHGDFLRIDPKDPAFSKIRAILLDPSCSGSGTVAQRLDYLLPSYREGQHDCEGNSSRIMKLASFQTRALAHALSFPSVDRVVYSTCSIHQEENEDVVKSVLELATSLNFQLASPFPQWPHRGLPVFPGAEHLLRTDVSEDKEGFFIALFVKRKIINKSDKATDCAVETICRRLGDDRIQSSGRTLRRQNKGFAKQSIFKFFPYSKMHRMLLFQQASNRRSKLKLPNYR